MKKNILATLLFLLLCSSIGYLLTIPTLSVANKLKAHFSIEEKVIYSNAPPIIIDPDTKSVDWDGELPKWRVLYRIIWGTDLADSLHKNGTQKKAVFGTLGMILILLLTYLYRLSKKRKKHDAALTESSKDPAILQQRRLFVCQKAVEVSQGPSFLAIGGLFL